MESFGQIKSTKTCFYEKNGVFRNTQKHIYIGGAGGELGGGLKMGYGVGVTNTKYCP